MEKKPAFELCWVMSRVRPAAEMAEQAQAVRKAGVDAVQLRLKEAGGKTLYQLAAALQERAGQKMILLINDRLDVALALPEAGVHLPANGLPPASARKLLGKERLLGRSIHREDELSAEDVMALDYVFFGPVFETASKRAFGPAQGVEKLAVAVKTLSLPVYAIGGITPDRLAEVRRAGAAGAAVISFLEAHPHPAAGAEELRRAWKETAGEEKVTASEQAAGEEKFSDTF